VVSGTFLGPDDGRSVLRQVVFGVGKDCVNRAPTAVGAGDDDEASANERRGDGDVAGSFEVPPFLARGEIIAADVFPSVDDDMRVSAGDTGADDDFAVVDDGGVRVTQLGIRGAVEARIEDAEIYTPESRAFEGVSVKSFGAEGDD